MNLMDRLRFLFAPTELKAQTFLPVVPAWTSASFITPDFYNVVWEGYNKNSAFLACVGVYTRRFPEPPLRVYDRDETGETELPEHPTRVLFRRPNQWMGEAEFWQYVIAYLAVGGNAYGYKLRNNAGQVIGLMPYHAGQMFPVPSPEKWVSHYEYDTGRGTRIEVPSSDIIHWKWPLPDMENPWQALAPIRAATREVQTDNEATRFLKALLQNDAVVRTAFVLPPDVNLDPEQFARFKGMIDSGFTGERKGRPALLEGGVDIKRLSLDLEEMAFEALHSIPETRIAGAMGVPAMMAGLAAGWKHSTYSNMREAVSDFTDGALVPLWRLVGDEVATDPDLNPNGDVVHFDTSVVRALQEDEDAKHQRYREDLKAGGITVNEFRQAVGQASLDAAGDIYLWPANVVPVRLNGSGIPEVLIERLPAQLTDGDGNGNESDVIDEAPENIEATAGLNGAQITAVLEVLNRVLGGGLGRVGAVELIIMVGMAQDRAELVVDDTLANARLPEELVKAAAAKTEQKDGTKAEGDTRRTARELLADRGIQRRAEELAREAMEGADEE